jgi:transposase
MLQATNPEGIPLYVRPHPGDAAELSCIGLALERLVQLLGPGVVICADSAFGHIKNLCEAHRAGLRFVIPLRSDSGFQERFLKEVGQRGLRSLRYVSRRERSLPPHRRTQYRGAIRPLIVTDPQTGEQRRFRVLYVWSSEEAASVKDARQRALDKADEQLGRVRRGLGGRYYRTQEQVDAKIATILRPAVRNLLVVKTGVRAGRPTLQWHRNKSAIAQVARTDGIYALATNLPARLSASRLLQLYKDQSLVERRHRDAKQTLRVRPLFLHNDDRIEALISIVGLALLLFGLIEAGVRRALGEGNSLEGILPEGRSAPPTGRSVLAAFQGLGLTYTQHGPMLDPLTRTQRRILELLEVQVPWPEKGNLDPLKCGKRG